MHFTLRALELTHAYGRWQPPRARGEGRQRSSSSFGFPKQPGTGNLTFSSKNEPKKITVVFSSRNPIHMTSSDTNLFRHDLEPLWSTNPTTILCLQTFLIQTFLMTNFSIQTFSPKNIFRYEPFPNRSRTLTTLLPVTITDATEINELIPGTRLTC